MWVILSLPLKTLQLSLVLVLHVYLFNKSILLNPTQHTVRVLQCCYITDVSEIWDIYPFVEDLGCTQEIQTHGSPISGRSIKKKIFLNFWTLCPTSIYWNQWSEGFAGSEAQTGSPSEQQLQGWGLWQHTGPKNLKPDFQSTNNKQLLVKEASSTAVQWQGPLGVGSQAEHHSSSSDASEGVGRGLWYPSILRHNQIWNGWQAL